MFVPRRFRGCIVSDLRDDNAPDTNDKFALTVSAGHRIANAINAGEIVMGMEHVDGHSVGKVSGAEVQGRNVFCNFEVQDPLAAAMIDRKAWLGLSLQHEEDFHPITRKPLGRERPREVSLCFGKSGMRPNTRILYELFDTNGSEHKANEGVQQIIQASGRSSAPARSSDMSSTYTFTRDNAPSTYTSHDSSSPLSFLNSHMNQPHPKQQQQAPPAQQQQAPPAQQQQAHQQQQQQQAPAGQQQQQAPPGQQQNAPAEPVDILNMTDEQIGRDLISPFMKSNLPQEDKFRLLDTIDKLRNEAKQRGEKLSKLETLNDNTIRTFANAVLKLSQPWTGEPEEGVDGALPLSQDEAGRELQELHRTGALSQLATMGIGRRVIAASKLCDRFVRKQEEDQKQLEEQRQETGFEKSRNERYQRLHQTYLSGSGGSNNTELVNTRSVAASSHGKRQRADDTPARGTWPGADVINSILNTKNSNPDHAYQYEKILNSTPTQYFNEIQSQNSGPALGSVDYQGGLFSGR
jgi:hypothetical protein